MNTASAIAARCRLVAFALVPLLLPTSNFAQESGGAGDFQYPISVAAAPDGTLYVADRKLPGVWKIQGGKSEVYFRGQKQFGTPLNAIRCVAIDKEGQLLAGDSATCQVYRFDGEGQPEPIHTGRIGIPMSIACDTEGQVYVSDAELGLIFRIPRAAGDELPECERVATIAAPRGIAVDGEDRVLVVSAVQNQVQRLNPEGDFEVVVPEMPFEYPATIAYFQNAIYVVDSYQDGVYRVNSEGAVEAIVSGAPLVHPVGITAGAESLFLVDPRANQVFRIAPDGNIEPVKR